MEEKNHTLIVINYELYSVENGKEVFVEKTEEQQPLSFYTDCDMTIPEFEKAVANLPTDTDFEFKLTKEQAYGEHEAEKVLSLDKALFVSDGIFNEKNIYVGAMIPLQNEDGDRFIGCVQEVSETKVKVDLNHPLAGKELKFRGHVMMNRPASEEEVNDFVERLQSHHCGGGCQGGCCGESKKGTCGCGNNEGKNCCGCQS